MHKLDELGLSVTNCRGQGYDNGANMRGCNKGVQARILQLERRALFMPCGCHSLNLVLCDMATSSPAAATLFGIIQQIYVLFSASTQRWAVFRKHVTNLTVKPNCETRWESRVNSVKAVRYQVGEIYDALIEVSETTRNQNVAQKLCRWQRRLKATNFL